MASVEEVDRVVDDITRVVERMRQAALESPSAQFDLARISRMPRRIAN
jgi:hypothetical protein